MTIKQWLEENKATIDVRYEELKAQNPSATILKPGYHPTIDGGQHFNSQFIIAK